MVILIFRYAYARPLKTKTAEETADAIQNIIEEIPIIPKIFQSDGGTEFSVRPGSPLYRVLIERFKMLVYISKGRTKSAIVEREE